MARRRDAYADIVCKPALASLPLPGHAAAALRQVASIFAGLVQRMRKFAKTELKVLLDEFETMVEGCMLGDAENVQTGVGDDAGVDAGAGAGASDDGVTRLAEDTQPRRRASSSNVNDENRRTADETNRATSSAQPSKTRATRGNKRGKTSAAS